VKTLQKSSLLCSSLAETDVKTRFEIIFRQRKTVFTKKILPCFHSSRVATGVGLCETEAPHQFPRRQSRQIFLTLSFTSITTINKKIKKKFRPIYSLPNKQSDLMFSSTTKIEAKKSTTKKHISIMFHFQNVMITCISDA
jgi:hypothetical protein